MTIKETINYIEGLKNDTEKKSEKTFYNTFNNILLSLDSKNLSEEKITLIENKLEKLDLMSNQEKKVKYLK